MDFFGRGSGASGAGNYGYALSWQDASPNTKIYFDIYSTTTRNYICTSSNPIIDNNWHFVVATWDGTTNANGMKIYLDGGLIIKNTATISAIGQPNYQFRIGRGSLGYFNGFVDDVRVYNAAIPDSQIKEIYYAGLNSLFKNGQITREEYVSRISGVALK